MGKSALTAGMVREFMILEIRDLPWAAQRVVAKAAVAALPFRAHLEIAFLRGRIHGLFSKAPAHVRHNLEAVNGSLGTADLDDIAGRYFEFSKRLYLLRTLPALPGFNNPRQWAVEGQGHLDAALADHRGAILATAHLGYGRIVAPILRAHGYDVKQVVAGGERVKHHEEEERWLANTTPFRRYVYQRTRVHADPLGPNEIVASLDVRPILEALSLNRPVMIAADGMRAAHFIRLPFLGTTYPFPTGFMKIAMATEAPLLPVFGIEGNRGQRIRVEIKPRLSIDPTASVADNLVRFVRVLEEQIREKPHLWCRWGFRNLFGKVVEWSEDERRFRYGSLW